MTPTINQHVVFTHKGRMTFGIVTELCQGAFGEPRARLAFVSGDHQACLWFPVCVEDLRPDTYGVVAGCLGAAIARATEPETSPITP